MVKITTDYSVEFVRDLFGNIGLYIDGSLPDTHGVRRVFWATLGHELFKRIHESYRVRSEGGTDDLGNRFKPLARSTIAQRPIKHGEYMKYGLTKQHNKRGILTSSQDAKWRGIFSKTVNKLSLTMDEDSAKRIAGKLAWSILKKDGAMTRIGTLGDRDVLIMRVTDAIYNSLEPSSGRGYHPYRPRRNQLFEIVGNRAEIGTLVEYARFHANSRPPIPPNIEPWVSESASIAMNRVMQMIKDEIL